MKKRRMEEMGAIKVLYIIIIIIKMRFIHGDFIFMKTFSVEEKLTCFY